METIYLITATTDLGDGLITSVIGWTDDKKTAQEHTDKLNTPVSNPIGHFSPEMRQAFEWALQDWAEVESDMYDLNLADCPYYDETKTPHVLNTTKYNAWMRDLEERIKCARADWFTEHYPGFEMSAEKFQAYDEWEDHRYDSTVYNVEPCKKLK